MFILLLYFTFLLKCYEKQNTSSPEQIVHDVLVVLHCVLWQVAGGEEDDGIHLISIVT